MANPENDGSRLDSAEPRPAEGVVRVLGQVGGAIHFSDLGRG